MNSKIVGGSVGVVMIGGGALIAWGGLTGTLAAILAAMFAPAQLKPVSGVIGTDVPPTLVPSPRPRTGYGQLPSGESGSGSGGSGTGIGGGPNPPAIENPPGEGEVVPPDAVPPGPLPAQLPPGDIPGDIPFEIPALPLP